MTHIPKINTQGTLPLNSDSSISSDSTSTSGAQDQNNEDLAEIENLRNKMLTNSTLANNTQSQANELRLQAKQFQAEVKNASSIESIKQLLLNAKEALQNATSLMNGVFKEAKALAKQAKAELEQRLKKGNGAQSGTTEDNQNNFLFDQRSNSSNNT